MRIFLSLCLALTFLFSYDISNILRDTPILASIKQVQMLQEKAFDSNTSYSEESMQGAFDEKQKYLQDILLHIKEDPYSNSFIIEPAFQERILFLKNRMALNLKMGNEFAVKRDEISLAYLEQLEYLNNYVLSLSDMVQAYATQKEIKAFAKKQKYEKKSADKESFAKLYQSIINDNNPVAQTIKEDFRSYVTTEETLDRLLEYTQDNSNILAQKTIFTLINYDDIINSVNASPSALWLNKKISFLYLNSGKLVALFVIILSLALSLYLIRWVLRFSVFNFKHYENRKLLRPVRLLLGVTALDYFTLMLMYPLAPKEIIDSFILLAYVMSFAYLSMEILAYIFVGYFETSDGNKNQKALISLSIDMLKMLIAISALVIFLNKMGVSLQTVLTTLGIFGLGIALAAKDSLSNFFGSLNILLDNTFSQGDIIRIDNLEGEVVRVGLRSTKIRAFDNSLIILPNAEASLKPIINWSKRRLGREIKTSISVSYSTDPQKLREIIEEIRNMLSVHPDLVNISDIEQYERESREDIFVSKRPLLGLRKEKFVYLDRFDASHLSIIVQTFSRTTDKEEWYEVKENILYSILEILKKHDIDFALPGQNLFLTK